MIETHLGSGGYGNAGGAEVWRKQAFDAGMRGKAIATINASDKQDDGQFKASTNNPYRSRDTKLGLLLEPGIMAYNTWGDSRTGYFRNYLRNSNISHLCSDIPPQYIVQNIAKTFEMTQAAWREAKSLGRVNLFSSFLRFLN